MLLAPKNDHVFVMNARSFYLNAPKGKCSTLADGLITIKSDETGLLTVYDLFTGEPLLPYEYERAYYATGYLYVYREGGWSIFKFILSAMALFIKMDLLSAILLDLGMNSKA